LKRIGNLLLKQDEKNSAEQVFKQSLELDRNLAEAAPDDIGAGRSLLMSLSRMAEVELKNKNFTSAKKHFDEAQPIVKIIIEQDSESLETKIALAVNAMVGGDIESAEGNDLPAKKQYEIAVSILQELEEAGKLNTQPAYNDLLNQAESKLEKK